MQLSWIIIWPVGCDFGGAYDGITTVFDDPVRGYAKLSRAYILQMNYARLLSEVLFKLRVSLAAFLPLHFLSVVHVWESIPFS